MEFKVLDKYRGQVEILGSSLRGHIKATYYELEDVLGLPTFEDASPDNKVQKEWVVLYEGNVFTVYDWKTRDEVYTMEYLNKFHIGGKTDASSFIKFLEEEIKALDLIKS